MANIVTIELPDNLAQQLRVADDGVTSSLEKLVLNTLNNLARLINELQSEDSLTRADAALKLGEAGAETAAVELAKVLRDSSGLVRYNAAVALKSIGTPEALTLLEQEKDTFEGIPLPDSDYAPLLALAGTLDIGTTDLGENHDYYIAQALEAELHTDE